MDPLSVVSLAGSIITFVDFSGKLISKGREISHSSTGSLSVHDEIKSANERIRQLSHELSSKYGSSSPHYKNHEQAIKQLCFDCVKTAYELNVVLDTLTARPRQKFASVRKALESIWKEKKVLEVERKLQKYSSELHLHLSAALCDGQSLALSNLWHLDGVLREFHVDSRKELLKARQDILDAIHQNRTMRWAGVLEADQLTAQIDEFVHNGNNLAKGRKMLERLRFVKMRVRQRNVRMKHQGTLDWIFDADHASRRLRFAEWLEIQNGIFWITGKAGSGKSTLMKFVCEHAHTRNKLLEWAGGKNLIVGSFFFWNAGTELEKSQQGLLRSLLFEILRQCPELITDVKSEHLQDPWRSDSDETMFTIDELTELFTQVIGNSADRHVFCFFIDGVDEFQGHPQDIARVLESFAAIPNVKLCLSSRPWTAFEETFGQFDEHKLTAEHHTVDDIEHYVNEVLASERLFVKLKSKDPRYEDLVKEIVAKANGVFLWVFLVVNQLRNTLSNKDTIEELQQRLGEFPEELEPYFRHILERVPKTYRESCDQALLASVEATEPLDLLTLSFMFDKRYDSMSMPMKPMSEKALKQLSQDARTRLKARCLDLLEVVNYNEYEATYEELEDPRETEYRENLDIGGAYEESIECLSWISRYKVDFLHRTVYDFLRQEETYQLIQSRVPKSFNPCEAICRANLAQLKVLPWKGYSLEDSANLLTGSLVFYSERDGAQRMLLNKPLLVEAERVIGKLRAEFGHTYCNPIFRELHQFTTSCVQPLLRVAVSYGYLAYISEKFEEEPGLSRDIEGWPPLLTALIEPGIFDCAPGYFPEIDPDTVDLLLKYGADPMQKVGQVSIWHWGLTSVGSFRQGLHSHSSSAFRVVSSLIKAGAKLTEIEEYGDLELSRPLDILKEYFDEADIEQFIAMELERAGPPRRAE